MPFLCSIKFPLTRKYTIDLSDGEKNVETCTGAGQQFHQYQQTEQSSLTLIHSALKKIMTCDVGNPGPSL